MKRTIEKILKKIGFPKEPSKWNAAKIIYLLIASRTPRIGQLTIKSARMWNTRPETAYKGIYRYLQKHDPQDYLPMFAPENPIYIAIDTTDIERPGAKKTPHVGYIREKKGEGVVRGFQHPHGRSSSQKEGNFPLLPFISRPEAKTR